MSPSLSLSRPSGGPRRSVGRPNDERFRLPMIRFRLVLPLMLVLLIIATIKHNGVECRFLGETSFKDALASPPSTSAAGDSRGPSATAVNNKTSVAVSESTGSPPMLTAVKATTPPPSLVAAKVGSIFAEDYQVSFEVGRSVDLFNRFGFLQLSFKVLPGVYAGKPEYIFIERSFPVFTPESRVIQLYRTPGPGTFTPSGSSSVIAESVPSTTSGGGDEEAEIIIPAAAGSGNHNNGSSADHSDPAADNKPTFQVFACESVVDVLVAYFSNFHVEGMSEPFKAFVPDFKKAKLSRSLGIEERALKADNRFLLIKVDLPRFTGLLDSHERGQGQGHPQVTDALRARVEQWAPQSQHDCLQGVAKVGSHVIRRLTVGDVAFQVIAYTPSSFEYVLEAMDGKTTLVEKSAEKVKHVLSPHYAAEVGKIMLASQDKAAQAYLRDQLWHFGVHRGRTPSIAALADHRRAVDAVRNGVGHVIIGADFAALINFVPHTARTDFCKRILFNAIQLYEANIM